MARNNDRIERAMHYIAQCNDAEKLKTMIKNATGAEEYEVRHAAELRL